MSKKITFGLFCVAFVFVSFSIWANGDHAPEIEMVRIAGGTFQMGSDSDGSGEKPAHSVTVNTFYMSKTEVTQGQWKAVMGSNPAHFHKGDDYPVEKVSWNDVQEFIRKLNQLTGKRYRLPTEAEWEYAARDGTSGDCYGDIHSIAMFDSNSGNSTHPVAQKQANAFGLYDMLGNVWEWCSDCYVYHSFCSQYHPAGPSSGSNPVDRDGSWGNKTRVCRTPVRAGFPPGSRLSTLGFRLAMEKPDAPEPKAWLLIMADIECDLTVNGSEFGRIPENGNRKVYVELGENLVKASHGPAGIECTEVITIDKPGQKVVMVALKAKVDEHLARKRSEIISEIETGMVRIFGGTFQMGSTSSEVTSDERPAHSVTLSSFYIGKHEVTQGQWKALMSSNPSYFKKGDNYPVERVSWNDVQELIRKLNQVTGKRYRLPTEAEWEYAARGTATGDRYGNIDDIAWYFDNSGRSTHPVAQKQANPYGLYDMLGNVWEWCSDWDGEYTTSAKTNPTGPSSGSYRVRRGASWYDNARFVWASIRFYFSPSSSSKCLGFRLAMDG